jgi:hypothetical protein
MSKAGLEEVRFRFDFDGTKVVLKMDSSMEMLYTFGSKTENTKCTQDYMKME